MTNIYTNLGRTHPHLICDDHKLLDNFNQKEMYFWKNIVCDKKDAHAAITVRIITLKLARGKLTL